MTLSQYMSQCQRTILLALKGVLGVKALLGSLEMRENGERYTKKNNSRLAILSTLNDKQSNDQLNKRLTTTTAYHPFAVKHIYISGLALFSP